MTKGPCTTCGENASLACSVCKTTIYCSAKCQLADWKAHKKSCAMIKLCNDVNARLDARPPPKPTPGRCTGCRLKFSSEDDEEEEDEDEWGGNYCEEECPDCGYMVCESCSSDQSNGTCYCPNSNFGRKYCWMEPRWWHQSGHTGKSYVGDRHPGEPGEYPDEMYESKARACGNCGEVTRLWKKEFCT